MLKKEDTMPPGRPKDMGQMFRRPRASVVFPMTVNKDPKLSDVRAGNVQQTNGCLLPAYLAIGRTTSDKQKVRELAKNANATRAHGETTGSIGRLRDH